MCMKTFLHQANEGNEEICHPPGRFLRKLSKPKRLRQNRKCNSPLAVRFQEPSHLCIPPRQHEVLTAAFPVFTRRCRSEKKQPIAIAINRHTDLIGSHASRPLGPKLIVRLLITLVCARPQRYC